MLALVLHNVRHWYGLLLLVGRGLHAYGCGVQRRHFGGGGVWR